MKIRKIIAKRNEDIGILIKRGNELISITIDRNNNIDINGYEDEMVVLEELTNLQFENQQIENDFIDSITNMPDFEDMELTDTVEFFNGLSARVYAYGIASEFLLVSGVSDDAEIWEERFKESLFVLSRKRGEHRLPKRSFL